LPGVSSARAEYGPPLLLAMQAPERCGSKIIVAGYARSGVPSLVGNLPWRYVIVYGCSAAINLLTISADLTPSNILFELTEINAWSEDTIYAKFGDILQEPVETTSGEPLGPHAPTYLVEAISVSNMCLDMITEHIRIVDFGQSFRCDSPPERGMGIPMSYMAPELLFENIAGTASDLWALGCTIYEIRAGRPLIDMFMGESPEDTAREIAHTLGAFLAAWNRITFGEEDCEPVGEEDDTKEMRPWIGPDQALEHPLVDIIADIEDEYPTSITDNIDDTEKGANMVSGRKESLFWKPPPQTFRVKTTESGEVTSTRTGKRATNPPPNISPEEASSFYDLLIKVLKYRWNERMEATELATHGWFHSQDTLA
jgi:serine/threonine protein kinase